jgi:hypothetical protein
MFLNNQLFSSRSSVSQHKSGAIYDANAVNIYKAICCLAHFENKNIFFYFQKNALGSPPQRRRCKFRIVGLSPDVSRFISKYSIPVHSA